MRTDDHSKTWADKFATVVNAMPEIVEFYRLAGDIDYIMKIIVGSVSEYDRTYRRLIPKIEILNVSASFAIEKMKFTPKLPLG